MMSGLQLELTVPIIAIIITFLLILLHIFISISSVRNEVTLFYDDSNSLNYHYQYLIRLLYDAKSTSFNDSITTIIVQIDHSINRTVKVPFVPSTMNRVFMYKGHRCAKIFMRTFDKYHDVRSAKIYHNGVGSILIHSIELQDIDRTNAIIAMVKKPAHNARFQRSAKTFPFGVELENKIEDDVRPTTNVTISETIFILYAVVNGIYFTTLKLLMKDCTSNTFCNLTTAFITGALSGAYNFVLFLLIIFPFRYLIKIYFSYMMGRGLAKFLRFIYLFIVIIGGMTFGAFTSDASLSKNYNNINANARILSAPYIWLICSAFGICCLICMIGICIPFAMYFSFIKLPDDKRKKKESSKIKKYSTIDDVEDVCEPTPSTNQKTKKNTSNSMSTFYNKKTTEQTNGGGGLKPAERTVSTEKDVKREKKRSKSSKKTTDKITDVSASRTSSVGDNYYAAMVKMANIRSVSQYHKQGK